MSTRMGDFKPLLPLQGKTVIENTVDSVFEGGAQKAVVVAGYRGKELEELLCGQYGSRVSIAWNREFDRTDMLHSVQIGCSMLPKCDAFFLLPGDMPAITKDTFQKILALWQTKRFAVVFPTRDGYRKHPPLIDACLIPEILNFRGEGGLRQFWKQYEGQIGEAAVNDRGVELDLDTREDYDFCKKFRKS